MPSTPAEAEVRRILGAIDHSCLTPTAREVDLRELCRVGSALGVASVCLLPHYVARAARLLEDSPVAVCTVVSFPHGATSPESKLAEARVALDAGATELDMVVNISAVLSGNWALVESEVSLLTAECHARGARLKLIFENCYLSRPQMLELCRICSSLDVDWVKTSTGFGQVSSGPSGATPEDVRFMRAHCPPRIQVKASGGVRTLTQARAMLELGATRIGTSNTLAIAGELGIELAGR